MAGVWLGLACQGKDMGVTLSRKRRRSSVVQPCDDDNHDIGLSNFTDTGLQFLAEVVLVWRSSVSFGALLSRVAASFSLLKLAVA